MFANIMKHAPQVKTLYAPVVIPLNIHGQSLTRSQRRAVLAVLAAKQIPFTWRHIAGTNRHNISFDAQRQYEVLEALGAQEVPAFVSNS